MTNDSAKAVIILVVEDEPAISELCRRVLAEEGFEVDTAGNGKLAMPMIEKKQYDILLLDIRTPAMNGVELYRWLQKEHPHLTGRVIFTTGSLIGGDTLSFITETGKFFLPKPFKPDELTNKVREALKETGR